MGDGVERALSTLWKSNLGVGRISTGSIFGKPSNSRNENILYQYLVLSWFSFHQSCLHDINWLRNACCNCPLYASETKWSQINLVFFGAKKSVYFPSNSMRVKASMMDKIILPLWNCQWSALWYCHWSIYKQSRECWWISFFKWSEEIICRNKYTRIVVIKNVNNRNSFRYWSGDFIFSEKRNVFRKPGLQKIWAFGLARQNFWEQLRARNVKMCTTMLTFSHCNTKRFFLMWMPPNFSIHLQGIFFSSLVTKKRALPSWIKIISTLGRFAFYRMQIQLGIIAGIFIVFAKHIQPLARSQAIDLNTKPQTFSGINLPRSK